MRRAAALIAIVVTVTSCHVARRTSVVATPATTKVGGGIVFGTPSPSAAPVVAPSGRSTAAALVLQLRDQNGNGPQGIAVHFDGPVHLVLLSDADGRVRLTGPAGAYAMHIDTGCYPAVVVSVGVRGTVHTYPGVTRRDEVRLRWRHRYAPSGSATSDASGDWTVGTAVHIRYDLADRCRNDLAPRASYPTFAFHASRTIAIVGSPSLRSDASGRGTVTIRCTAPGDARLDLGDERDPPDSVDLVGAIPSYSGRPRCVSR